MKFFIKIISLLLVLTPVFVFGQTDVSGQINGDTWTAAGSPYRVTGDLTIQALTIEPGVTVAFTDAYEFKVTGWLVAAGTGTDSIFFQNDPAFSSSWNGIIIDNTSPADTLRYVRISDASPAGITIQNLSTYLEHCQISNNNVDGIVLSSGSAGIFRTSILGNGNHGLVAESGGNALLKAVKIMANNNKGIMLNSGKAILENVIISGNTNGGIDLETAQDTLAFTNIVIADNEFAYAIDAVDGHISGKSSIIYFNRSSPIRAGSAFIDIRYSNIQNEFTGEGNFANDPLFSADPDYTLLPGSPCIDRGNPDPLFNDICFPPSRGGVRNDAGAYGGPGACEWLDRLSVYPDTIAFGSTTVGIPEDTTLKIQNARNFPLRVTRISVSGTGNDAEAFTVDTTAFILGPYENRSIAVNFNPPDERNYEAYLEISGSGEIATVQLRGSGRYAIFDIDRTSIDFRNVSVGEIKAEKVFIENTSDGIVRIDSLKFTDDHFFQIRSLPIEILPGPDRLDSLIIYFEPDTISLYSGQIEFIDNNPINTKITLTGTGQAPVIHSDQDTLRFGDIPVGTGSIDRIIIMNKGSKTLDIDSLRILPAESFFTIHDDPDRIAIQPGASDTLQLHFSPDTICSDTVNLLLYNNDPFKGRNPFVIPITGRGVKPVAAMIPADSVYFAEAIVGSRKTAAVTVKNRGNAGLLIGSYFLDSSTPFSVTAYPADTLIAPEDSVVFQVLFEPDQKDRNYRTQLRIPTNDSDRDTLLLILSGRSVQPVLSGNDPLEFGGVVIRQQADRPVELRNSGSGSLVIDTLFISGADAGAFFLSAPPFPYFLDADTLKFIVTFAPAEKGLHRAQIMIRTNLPDSGAVDSIEVTGTGLQPVLALSKQVVSFDTTYIRESSVDTVTLFNPGNGTLSIDSLIFSAGGDLSDFSILDISGGVPDLPLKLDTGGKDTLLVRFEPDSVAWEQRRANLLIYSNDPDRSPHPDTLRIFGIARSPVIIQVADQLSFGPTYVDQDTAGWLVIRNRGERSDLIISAIGFEESDDAVFTADIGMGMVIAPNDLDSLLITFKPRNDGTVDHVLRLITNDPIYDTVMVSLSGTGRTDTSRAEITFTQFPDSLVSGMDYTIQISLSGNQAPVTWCKLRIRPGARAEYDSVSMQPAEGSDSLWKADLPGDLITERGLEYYVDIRHGGGRSTEPADSAARHPLYMPVFVPFLKYPEPTRTNHYQMISLPVESGGRPLSALFGDTLGSYDNTQYRMFEYDSGYYELVDMDRSLPRGKALWLITRNSRQLAVHDVSAPEKLDTVSIPLNKEWNVIGNPFPFAVPVAGLDLSVVHPTLFTFTETGWDTVTPGSFLEPFKGYAVYTQTRTELEIPPVEGNAVFPKKSPLHTPAPEWELNIIAVRGRFHDAYNTAGIHEHAAAGFDRYDLPEPPSPGSYVSVYFQNPETPLTADFRAPVDTASGYRFDFSVVSNFTGTTVLTFNDERLPSGYHYSIVSDETGVRYDDPRNIEVSADRQDFILYVGEAAFIEKATAAYQSLPVSYALHQNYPNPFNPATSIRYSLPVADKIDLVVYDILGRVVRKLQTGMVRDAGYHTVIWDGTNDHQQAVASGIYFLALRSPAYQHTIKMLLQR